MGVKGVALSTQHTGRGSIVDDEERRESKCIEVDVPRYGRKERLYYDEEEDVRDIFPLLLDEWE